MNCPNCGNEIIDESQVCPNCGNPLSEDRPWDKKAKKNQGQVDRKPAQKGRVAGKSRLDETYLKDDFIVNIGFCGYSANPENPEKLKSGTVIITKRAILFGESEFHIKTGRYDVEIPVENIDHFTNGILNGKKVLILRTKYGQDFYVTVLKLDEWNKYFGYVLNYVSQDPLDASDDRKNNPKNLKWMKVGVCIVIAFICYLIPVFVTVTPTTRLVTIGIAFGFLLLALVTFFKKKP